MRHNSKNDNKINTQVYPKDTVCETYSYHFGVMESSGCCPKLKITSQGCCRLLPSWRRSLSASPSRHQNIVHQVIKMRMYHWHGIYRHISSTSSHLSDRIPNKSRTFTTWTQSCHPLQVRSSFEPGKRAPTSPTRAPPLHKRSEGPGCRST